jgi:hypothetical protein
MKSKFLSIIFVWIILLISSGHKNLIIYVDPEMVN